MVSKFRRIQRSKSISAADKNICLFGNELYAGFYERQLVSVGQLIKSIAKNEFSTHTVRCVMCVCFVFWVNDGFAMLSFYKRMCSTQKGFFLYWLIRLFVCLLMCVLSFIHFSFLFPFLCAFFYAFIAVYSAEYVAVLLFACITKRNMLTTTTSTKEKNNNNSKNYKNCN